MGARLAGRQPRRRARRVRRRARRELRAVQRRDRDRQRAHRAVRRMAADAAPGDRAYAGPDVPVLVLSGRADLRTPLEDARRTAAQYPRAQVLAVPGVGHSVLTTDISGCALAARSRSCAPSRSRSARGRRAERAPRPSPRRTRRPRSARFARPRLDGVAGRTISAVTVTLTGIGFDLAASPPDGTTRYPGLRGGYVRGSARSLQLVNAEWIRGVRVSGPARRQRARHADRERRPGERDDHLHPQRRTRRDRRSRLHPALNRPGIGRASDTSGRHEDARPAGARA